MSFALQSDETPGLVCMHGQVLVVVAKRPVKIDHAGDEGGFENPDASQVHEVDRLVGTDRVVSEVWIAVDDGVPVERDVPRAKHVRGDGIANSLGLALEREQGLAVQPGHGEKPIRRQRMNRLGHVHALFSAQHAPVQCQVRRFPAVVELLMQPGRKLGVNLGRIDSAVVAPVDREDHLELVEVGLDDRAHVRILQLAGEVAAFDAARAVDLPQRGGRGGFAFERGEGVSPIGAQLRGHAPLHERPTHGRRVGLKLTQFLEVFLGQHVGDGRKDLRHLHQRPLETAKRVLDLDRVLAAVELEPEYAPARETGGEAADRRADAGVSFDASREGCVFLEPVVGRHVSLRGHVCLRGHGIKRARL